MARLDRLVAVKALAQLGATLGREFAYELLQAVSPWDEGTVQRGLHHLVEAEFLFQQGLPPQATYLFKHALIQDAAYQSLLRSTRQQHHQHIAQVLEAQFPDICKTQPELLAHHYTEAGLYEQAIPYWQQAGESATAHSAHMEAIRHLTKGLDLLKTLPSTPERLQRELLLHIALGAPLIVTRGWGALEVEHTYARARELCQQLEAHPQHFQVLWGLWSFYLLRGKYQTALELGEQLLTLAQHGDDAALLVVGYLALGTTLFLRGEVAPARRHFEQGLAVYDQQQHGTLGSLYVFHPRVGYLALVAPVLWALGYPEQALQRSQAAVALAQELSHPFSLAFALFWAALLHQLRHEAPQAQAQAQAAMTVATAQGFVLYETAGAIVGGWALATQGQATGSLGQMHQGLAAYRATGTEQGVSWYLALLAEAYGRVGQAEAGLPLLAEALVLVANNGEGFYAPELHRLTGELLLQQAASQAPQAEACVRQALALAHRQQAKSWELRAAMSLSRTWQQQGKRAEARQLLAATYGWFTEGFDTADLQEARTLLEKLT
jgi:predicted ATPase